MSSRSYTCSFAPEGYQAGNPFQPEIPRRVLAGVVTLGVMVALAVPVRLWRTGEVPLPELQYVPPARAIVNAARVWIDADAACGTGKRRDPDDCLALLSLTRAGHIDIAGISTVFGNAPVSKRTR